jgi:hypothetical protein
MENFIDKKYLKQRLKRITSVNLNLNPLKTADQNERSQLMISAVINSKTFPTNDIVLEIL